MAEIKLTPALRRILAFTNRHDGVAELQIVASGGRTYAALQALRRAGYVENYYPAPVRGYLPPDRVRITEAGKAALARAEASP